MSLFAHTPLRGELVWFNEAEDHGVLESEEGERLEFDGDAFAGGERPSGRVGGLLVHYQVDGSGTVRQVAIVLAGDVKRARRRRG
jgi:hypothetical protein